VLVRTSSTYRTVWSNRDWESMLHTDSARKVAVNFLNYGAAIFYKDCATEMLQITLKDTEKITIIWECQIVVFSFLLTVDFERCENITECGMMLAIHFLYVMYKWKSRSSKLRDSLSSVPDFLQLAYAPPMLQYNMRYNTAVVSLSHLELVTYGAPTGRALYQWFFSRLPTTPRLQDRFFSQTNTDTQGPG
jgi:hypothetical protein